MNFLSLMKKAIYIFVFIACAGTLLAQNNFSPEALWKLGRVSGLGVSLDGKDVVYRVSQFSIEDNKSASKIYAISLSGGEAREIKSAEGILFDKNTSADQKYSLTNKEVEIHPILGKDVYPQYPKSNVYIYDQLNYRHWDTWEEGKYDHVFLTNKTDKSSVDLMPNEAFDCPQKPFGGDEDYIFSPDSKKVLYVTKKKYGTDYAISTNTDIFEYDIATGKTINLTEENKGYDVAPAFSKKGILAYLSMKRDGYESDKNDIIIYEQGKAKNITAKWDGTVNSFLWSKDGTKIFFNAPIDGTEQIFEINPLVGETSIKPITKGMYDFSHMVGQAGNLLIASRTDMNHAVELFSIDISNGAVNQITHVNDAYYKTIEPSNIEKKYVTTTDGKKMLVYVIYPPNFDKTKKYPTLLYCQGGPQSSITQFYSFRWNFALMASQGYIVVAPCRRGMPGFGVQWNEEISKDYGGQVMNDYLTAIDEVAKEPFIDKTKLGCVGASYGGYSVFYLAGTHQNRFKSFIAHDGIFNLRSMYGNTEEVFFPNWDFGGNYWDKTNAAQKTYTQFDPSDLVEKWNTPILIIQGEKDFRVPVGQGLEAFQAAQLKGIKSKLLIFPDENHWVLKAQNGLVWQSEFFKWLKETL